MFIYEGMLEHVRSWIHVYVIRKWHFGSVVEITLENTLLMNENLSCVQVGRIDTLIQKLVSQVSELYGRFSSSDSNYRKNFHGRWLQY